MSNAKVAIESNGIVGFLKDLFGADEIGETDETVETVAEKGDIGDTTSGEIGLLKKVLKRLDSGLEKRYGILPENSITDENTSELEEKPVFGKVKRVEEVKKNVGKKIVKDDEIQR